jgi:predicted site-specific integrase-resolvase
MPGSAIVAEVSNVLVPTGVAAREIGVARGTLTRWWRAGYVKPALVTAGGHARWDVDKLRRDLRQMER